MPPIGLDELLSAAAAATSAKKGCYGIASSHGSTPTAATLPQEVEDNWCAFSQLQHTAKESNLHPASQLPALTAQFAGFKKSVDKGKILPPQREDAIDNCCFYILKLFVIQWMTAPTLTMAATGRWKKRTAVTS